MLRNACMRATAGALLLSGATCAIAQELPTAKAESVGMSSERLARIDSAMQRHIAAGDIAAAERDYRAVEIIDFSCAPFVNGPNLCAIFVFVSKATFDMLDQFSKWTLSSNFPPVTCK